MTGARHLLAQVNIARLREPLDSPRLADFVANLDPVNALADRAPGFVWRLQTEDGNATAIRMFDDDMLIVNMSVWGSLDALRSFAFDSAHRDVMRRRREWFDRLAEAYVALWWLPADRRPTVGEAQWRLQHLRTHGPSPVAFTFRRTFGPDDAAGPATDDDRWACPAG